MGNPFRIAAQIAKERGMINGYWARTGDVRLGSVDLFSAPDATVADGPGCAVGILGMAMCQNKGLLATLANMRAVEKEIAHLCLFMVDYVTDSVSPLWHGTTAYDTFNPISRWFEGEIKTFDGDDYAFVRPTHEEVIAKFHEVADAYDAVIAFGEAIRNLKSYADDGEPTEPIETLEAIPV